MSSETAVQCKPGENLGGHSRVTTVGARGVVQTMMKDSRRTREIVQVNPIHPSSLIDGKNALL